MKTKNTYFFDWMLQPVYELENGKLKFPLQFVIDKQSMTIWLTKDEAKIKLQPKDFDFFEGQIEKARKELKNRIN